MKSGTVKWFDSKKGYEFIIGDDGIDCFVHQSVILMKGFRYYRNERIVMESS